VTSEEICAVSWGSSFCNFCDTSNKIFMSTLPQTTGNALINCINAAHKKYESNAMDWQRVIEIGRCLLTRADMERFEQMCKDWGQAIMESLKIGRLLISQGRGISVAGMG
jgi:hypothetical protein